MKKNNLIRKTFEYLKINAGTEISKSEMIKMFSVPSLKKNSKKIQAIRQELENSIRLFWDILATEGLVTLKKKHIIPNKPFHLRGKISFNRKGDGFVRLPSGYEIFIPAEEAGYSMNGDMVEVVPNSIGKKSRLEGEVIDIIKRSREFYRMKVNHLEGNYISGTILDIPGDIKEGLLHKRSILKDTLDAIQDNDVLIVKLRDTSFKDNLLYEVSFIRFESDTKSDPDLERILMKYNYTQTYPDILSNTYSDSVEETSVSDWHSRVDLRNLYTVTIDGETAKDFDDAISFVEEENSIRFYVHIADVSYYVKQNSALDDEAYQRSTSVYLNNRVIPMLPPELSENLCSLVADKNRLAFTVEMVGNYSGEIFFAKFYKSIIKVDKRYTYEMAEKEILTADPNNWLCKIHKLTTGLKNKRITDGRVELDLKEAKPILDEEGNVTEIKLLDRLESHILIEELMLSANIMVAEKLRKSQVPSLFRIHEPMAEDKLETLNSFLRLYGFKHQIRGTSYSDLKRALAVVKDEPAEKLFNYFVLRSFMQAYYSGDKGGHWGLGFEHYSHFTSPIRRYPDLVCHRALDALMQKEKYPYSKEQILSMGYHCSDEERRAISAERDILKLKACRYVESKGITSFIGSISGIRPQAIFVEIADLNVEGVIRHIHFTDEEELVIPNDFSFVSKKYSKQFSLGQKLDLELEKIDIENIRIFVRPPQ
ncbi:MAG: VacB/RNase II family 3'-5' exoribonuclease [Spirochaetota bacterium]